jgi:hypothetical protein
MQTIFSKRMWILLNRALSDEEEDEADRKGRKKRLPKPAREAMPLNPAKPPRPPHPPRGKQLRDKPRAVESPRLRLIKLPMLVRPGGQP